MKKLLALAGVALLLLCWAMPCAAHENVCDSVVAGPQCGTGVSVEIDYDNSNLAKEDIYHRPIHPFLRLKASSSVSSTVRVDFTIYRGNKPVKKCSKNLRADDKGTVPEWDEYLSGCAEAVGAESAYEFSIQDLEFRLCN